MPPDKLFIIVFTNHNFEEVYASNKKAAKILGQAEQIKKGNSYNIAFVKNENGKVI